MTKMRLALLQIVLNRVFRDYFWSPIGKAIFLISGASFGQKLKVSGPINLRIFGDLELGDCVRINSGYRLNFVGGSEKFSLWVGKNANVTIASHVGLSNCLVVSMTSVSIGEQTFIGGGVRIYDTDFHPLSGEERMAGVQGVSKGVSIGSKCFIGAHSIILKGAQIGNNSIVGAGSVVSGVIPENQIWAGNPAKYIRDL